MWQHITGPWKKLYALAPSSYTSKQAKLAPRVVFPFNVKIFGTKLLLTFWDTSQNYNLNIRCFTPCDDDSSSKSEKIESYMH